LPEIGVRELKARASEIVRKVRDERVRYVITRRGQPVGLLIPLVDSPRESVEADAVRDRLGKMGQEIARGWPAGLDSGQVLSEMRR
jgi:prevent-host-death family protein